MQANCSSYRLPLQANPSSSRLPTVVTYGTHEKQEVVKAPSHGAKRLSEVFNVRNKEHLLIAKSILLGGVDMSTERRKYAFEAGGDWQLRSELTRIMVEAFLEEHL
jgi:hypothetical protein